MKIVLSGVETNNKGAELMLYAILQEVERKFPETKVYIAPRTIRQGLNYVHTSLGLRYWPYSRLIEQTHVNGFLRRLHLPILTDKRAVKADYFLDGSGFRFSDQTNLWGSTSVYWEKLLKYQNENGARIVFLPQAFGPIDMDITKHAVASLGRYATIVMPRDKVSYDYLKESGLVNMQKVRLFTDFTSLVEGVFPKKYSHLKDGICIIPNIRMIEKKKIGYEEYINFLSAIIMEAKKSGHPVYLLNHEGLNDEKLAFLCQKSLEGKIEVVTRLNALEVKGLISSAYLVITARFHGLVSALNSCVPSIATSWSHKYKELFRDYFPDESVNEDFIGKFMVSLDDINSSLEKMKMLLDNQGNIYIREKLATVVPTIKVQTKEMWKMVWEDDSI